LAPEFLDYLRHIRPRIATTTYQRKRWQAASFCKYLAANGKTITGVKHSDVESYLAGITCTRQFRQAACFVVREFYEVLRLRHPDVCPVENPAAGIKFTPDKSRSLPKVPSQSAIDEIFTRLYENDGVLHIRNRLMAELAYGSGLRRAELANLDIEDINLEDCTVQVLGKGNKPRVVPLTERAVNTFREYLRCRHASRGPLLLSCFGHRLGVTGVYEIMRNRVGIRPHLMRHACATHLLKNGCGIRVIQELLGHERIDSTYIYTAIDKENLREVIASSHPRAIIKK
jgi:site-specific recombinase XerD